MALAPGTKLGPYEVVTPLGAGGMGEVYRARDTRLARDVAIKVLPGSFAEDPDRLHRFETEARAAGALNHPNILAIYDLGKHDGTAYVVTELLEGQTLRARIGDLALPVRKALDVATQVARGLAAAHEKGIVHRDLKPDNIFITKDGRAKILDFGLAKLVGGDLLTEGETASADLRHRTGAGTVLGTVGYMSPEQVRARPVDHRSDIFSFGAVLYEMLSGQRAFRGASAVETMNAILKDDPPSLSQADRHLPPALERIVSHCLEKDPEDRFQSARDIAFDLEALSGPSAPSTPSLRSGARARTKRAAAAALVVLAVIAAITGAFYAGKQSAVGSRPAFESVTFRRGNIGRAAFAPGGDTIVYSALWEGNPSEMFSTHPGSPESRSLGLTNTILAGMSSLGEMAVLIGGDARGGRTLARVPLGGGAPREVREGVFDAAWAPDGRSLLAVRQPEARAQIEFPIGRVIYRSDGLITWPRVSPKGDRVAFLEHPVPGDSRGDLTVVDLAGNKTSLSAGWEDVGGLAWHPNGAEVWFTAADAGSERMVYAVTLGGRRRLVERVPGHLVLQDISRGGDVLLSHGARRPVTLGFVAGAAREVDLSWLDYPVLADLSADGKRVLLAEEGSGGGSGYSVYLRGMDGSPAVRLGKGFAQALSPDGKWALALELGPLPQLVLLPTGAGEPRTLPRGAIQGMNWAGFFPDGNRILVNAIEAGHGRRLYVQDLTGGAPRPITPEGVGSRADTISPDGQNVVAGRPAAIYPVAGGPPRPIPGLQPDDFPQRWDASGRVLYVRAGGPRAARIYRLDVSTGRRELWKELAPADLAGVEAVLAINLTADGKSYAYTYIRHLSNLYLVRGLR